MSKKITVLCGGAFNTLHGGHLYFLKSAKSLGNYLIVVVSNDTLNKKKYRKKAVSAEVRKRNLEKLKIADKIILGNKPVSYKKTIARYRPDIIALGFDQNIELGRAGLKIIRLPKFQEHRKSVSRK